MSRHSDPVRIYAAQRAGMTRRLVEAFGMSEERAEASITAWEQESEWRGLPRLAPGYWTIAEAWMLERPH